MVRLEGGKRMTKWCNYIIISKAIEINKIKNNVFKNLKLLLFQ